MAPEKRNETFDDDLVFFAPFLLYAAKVTIAWHWAVSWKGVMYMNWRELGICHGLQIGYWIPVSLCHGKNNCFTFIV